MGGNPLASGSGGRVLIIRVLIMYSSIAFQASSCKCKAHDSDWPSVDCKVHHNVD